MPQDDRLRISGLTGVDIELDIAGAGTRSYAFVIDWHIRVLIALAWILLVVGINFGQGGIRNAGWIVGAPAGCIYFLYHPIIEILLRGSTPGKRMAGVRIVTRQGGTPSIGALLVRNVFRLVDSAPALYLVGLLCCLFTEQRVRIGDMAAGTLLVREPEAAAKTLGSLGTLVSQSGLEPDMVELIDDLLQRWHALDVSSRATLARTILARVDPATTTDAWRNLNDGELQRRLQAALQGSQRKDESL
jgi:uncharacterized RDD family membrane protein YckC